MPSKSAWDLARRVARRRWHAVPLAVAVLLVIRMASVSAVNAHPDESFHIITASYYLAHWLPPSPHDPDIARYLHSCYGSTYLLSMPPDFSYWVAGKAAAWIDRLPGLDQAHALRTVQVLMFIGLALLAGRRPPGDPLVLAILLTPQVWYVFSYFNGDALPFFLSLVLAYELGHPASSARRFLEADDGRRHAWGALTLIGLTALLAVCRRNYLIVVAFTGACGLWLAARAEPGLRGRVLRRGLLVVAAVSVIFGVLVADLVARGGSDFKEAKTALKERYAGDGFKPSQIGKPDSFPGLTMKQRGVPLRYLFNELQWHHHSFDSFFGVYGYMKIYAPEWLYAAYASLLILTGGLAAWAMRRVRDPGRWCLFGVACAFMVLAVGQSLYHSWTVDCQAQGRYLFPMIPMAALAWRLIMPPDGGRIPGAITVAAFALASYSFVRVGLAAIAR